MARRILTPKIKQRIAEEKAKAKAIGGAVGTLIPLADDRSNDPTWSPRKPASECNEGDLAKDYGNTTRGLLCEALYHHGEEFGSFRNKTTEELRELLQRYECEEGIND